MDNSEIKNPVVNRSWSKWAGISSPLYPVKAKNNTVDSFGLSAANTFGIEVEVENIFKEEQPVSPHNKDMSEIEYNHNQLSAAGYWNWTEDSSLRNYGCEYVSKPLNGPVVSHALKNLFAHIPDDADFSSRCGIHVHVNCRDMTTEEIQKAILVYALFEIGIFSFAETDRRNNIFCVPLYSTEAIADALYLNMNSSRLQKYSALNILPLQEYGTIEFRHLHSTNNMEELQTWLTLIDRIWVFARTPPLSFSELMNQVFSLTQNSAFSNFGVQVFGNLWPIIESRDLQRGYLDSIISLKTAWCGVSTSHIGTRLASWLDKKLNKKKG